MISRRVWRLGDNIDTDVIIAGYHCTTSDLQVLAAHCLEALRPEFPSQVREGDIVIAGKNFGCGSSREHAALALQACGVSLVIARSFARIFYRNAINIGLPLIKCDLACDRVTDEHQVEVDWAEGIVKNLSTGECYEGERFPQFVVEMIEAGGLINYMSRRIPAKTSEEGRRYVDDERSGALRS